MPFHRSQNKSAGLKQFLRGFAENKEAGFHKGHFSKDTQPFSPRPSHGETPYASTLRAPNSSLPTVCTVTLHPQALPPDFTTQFLPGASQCQGSLSFREEALFSSWYKDLQFPLVSCWRQHVCWAASFSKKFTGLQHSAFS